MNKGRRSIPAILKSRHSVTGVFGRTGKPIRHHSGRDINLGQSKTIPKRLNIAALIAGILIANESFADPSACAKIGKPILRTERAGSVIAYFAGSTHASDKVSSDCCIEGLWLEILSDGGLRRFEPEGEVFFSDWDVDVLSPGGQYLLLPQGRYGPLDVVVAAEAPDYLEGQGKARFSLQWREEADTASVHSAAVWHDSDTGSFLASCCGESRVVAFDLTATPDHRLHPASKEEYEARLRARLPGRYKVNELLPASDTPHTLSMRREAERQRNDQAIFGDNLLWRDGGLCRSWDIRVKDGDPPEEAVLERAVGERALSLGQWADLICNGRRVDELFLMDEAEHRFITRIPNGTAWQIWRWHADTAEEVLCAATEHSNQPSSANTQE